MPTEIEKTKPTLYLWNAKDIGVILFYSSGVCYSNQTGGYACHHPKEEGLYLPLHNALLDQEAELLGFFTGPKWQGWCCQGIDDETALFVDMVLSKSPYTRMLKVDRSRFKDSHEAWIYVTIEQGVDDADEDLFREFPKKAGVLTWENSD